MARTWPVGARGWLSVHHEVMLARWDIDDRAGTTIHQIGWTVAIRYWPGGAPRGWFVEGGIGPNLLMPVFRTEAERFSTSFNFGDHVAAGYRSAPDGWEGALRVQHFSNGGIKHPNPGKNFIQLHVALPLGR